MPTRRTLLAATAALLLVSAPQATAAGADEPPSLLGAHGRGPDHVGIAVRDLDQARADFTALGFKVRDGGRFPGGAHNAVIPLDDHFYIELITAPADAKPDDKGIYDFAQKHEGGMFLGLHTSSAQSTADYLRAHGVDAHGPDAGGTLGPNGAAPDAPQWYSVSTPDTPAPGKRGIDTPIFFISYTPAREIARPITPEQRAHPNGVIGVRAVWIGVHDLDGQLKALAADGFPAPGRVVEFEGRKGREFRLGAAFVNLVETPGKPGDDEDERVLGVTLVSRDLARTRGVMAVGGRSVVVERGAYGRRVVASAALTHGLRVEVAGR